MNIQKSVNECGRSIIEMLGVLAIIGVLVLGATFSYLYAMDLYRTNRLKAELHSMAMTASIKLSDAAEFQLSNLSDFKFQGNLDYPFEGKLNDDRTFTISVSGLPKGVCTVLRKKNWTLPFKILINDVENGQCQEKNQLAFSFYNMLNKKEYATSTGSSGTGTVTASSATKCGTCEKGCNCETATYWCAGDSCFCKNEKVNPPLCNQDPVCMDLVQITNCDGSKTDCCRDTSICEKPDC